jgi:hypothetical protein
MDFMYTDKNMYIYIYIVIYIYPFMYVPPKYITT